MGGRAPVGVIHGRFQPVHNGHMKYLLGGKQRCEHLIVGITNPDPSLSRSHPANTQRSEERANPFTFYERAVILRQSLCEAGLELAEFSIAPFPVTQPELIRYYVPLDALFFLTIYDDWGRAKLQTLQSLGLSVDVMWTEPNRDATPSSTDVRNRMAEGQPWEHLVPPAAVRVIKAMGLDRRVRDNASTATAPKG